MLNGDRPRARDGICRALIGGYSPRAETGGHHDLESPERGNSRFDVTG